MDIVHFWYIYVILYAEYDYDNFKFVSLSVCLLLTKTGSIIFSLTIGPIFPIFSHIYVKFDADYDSDGFKVVSLFVCLLLTKTGSSCISLFYGPILLFFCILM